MMLNFPVNQRLFYALATGAGGVAIARWRFGFLAFPFFYLLVEWARSSFPFGGFSWVRLAWGQVNGPLANLAVWGGPALVTFAAVLVGAALVGLAFRRTRWVALSAALLPLAAGLITGLTVVNRDEPTVGEVEVAAIQGNVPRMGLDFNAQRRAVLANHARVTESLEATPDIVIWPENSSDVNPFADEEAAPLLCAGIIGYAALQRCELPAGGTLALYGFGSSAHVVMQIARHRGSRVYVVTRGDSHRRLARQMGAAWAGGPQAAADADCTANSSSSWGR